jgi:hypothetical protein
VRPLPSLLTLLALLVGCPSRGQIREHERPAPPPPPRQLRFELVETARVATGSKVELSIPLASSEAGVQEIERLDVTIAPDAPYEVSSDSLGNRTLHLVTSAPVEVKVSYRVLRTETSSDLLHVGPLSHAERGLLAPDLAPTNDKLLGPLRAKGHPARRIHGVIVKWQEPTSTGADGIREASRELKESAESDRPDERAFDLRALPFTPVQASPGVNDTMFVVWAEVYVSGRGWVHRFLIALFPRHEGEESVPPNVLVLSHGTSMPLPRSWSDGQEATPDVSFRSQVLEPR